MLTTIHIENLTFKAIVGVYDEERLETQSVIVNADITYDYDGEYIDHVVLAETIKQNIKTNKYKTTEEALKNLCRILKKCFPKITKIKLKITKPDYKADYVFSNSVVC